jgi:hypothetical protein
MWKKIKFQFQVSRIINLQVYNNPSKQSILDLIRVSDEKENKNENKIFWSREKKNELNRWEFDNHGGTTACDLCRPGYDQPSQ